MKPRLWDKVVGVRWVRERERRLWGDQAQQEHSEEKEKEESPDKNRKSKRG